MGVGSSAVRDRFWPLVTGDCWVGLIRVNRQPHRLQRPRITLSLSQVCDPVSAYDVLSPRRPPSQTIDPAPRLFRDQCSPRPPAGGAMVVLTGAPVGVSVFMAVCAPGVPRLSPWCRFYPTLTLNHAGMPYWSMSPAVVPSARSRSKQTHRCELRRNFLYWGSSHRGVCVAVGGTFARGRPVLVFARARATYLRGFACGTSAGYHLVGRRADATPFPRGDSNPWL